MKKILFIAGTRPEVIKLAPLYLEMRKRKKQEPVFCATGQHGDLQEQALDTFQITPDFKLKTMEPGQGLASLTGRLFGEIAQILKSVNPALAIVQGDTVSAFAGGWAAFFEKIPVAHVEAGLRTDNLDHPFPEEANRRALSIVTTIHFAPTPQARDNLLKEGVKPETVVVTGNTSIDALYRVLEHSKPAPRPENGRTILVTGHRRENFGPGLASICEALIHIAKQFPDVKITYTLHPNPDAADPVRERLSAMPNINLVTAREYSEFVRMMADSDFIISDSGGVQEEAPALGRPVLVTRETTERPEALAAGSTRLVGTKKETIIQAATELLTNPATYREMATAVCPYGDGKAAERICDTLEKILQN